MHRLLRCTRKAQDLAVDVDTFVKSFDVGKNRILIWSIKHEKNVQGENYVNIGKL